MIADESHLIIAVKISIKSSIKNTCCGRGL